MPSPIEPVKVSELNFIPELFFDVIARILPGSFVLGFAYLYIEIFTQPPYNLAINVVVSKIPIWSTPIIAYYLSIVLGMIFIFFNPGIIKTIDDSNCRIYELTHNAPEDRARFIRILAEFNSSLSIFVGLTLTLILSFALLINNKIEFYCQNNLLISLLVQLSSSITIYILSVAIIVLFFLCFIGLKKGFFQDIFIIKNLQAENSEVENSKKLFTITFNITTIIIIAFLFFGLTIIEFLNLSITIQFPNLLKPDVSLIVLFTINIFFLIGIFKWKERLKGILETRLDDYAEYKNFPLRENWDVKFNNNSVASVENKVKRFDVFKNNNNSYFLILSPNEINNSKEQILVLAVFGTDKTDKQEDYPTRIDCKVTEKDEGKDPKIIKFAFDKFHTINKEELFQQKLFQQELFQKFGQVMQSDRSKILDILAKIFA